MTVENRTSTLSGHPYGPTLKTPRNNIPLTIRTFCSSLTSTLPKHLRAPYARLGRRLPKQQRLRAVRNRLSQLENANHSRPKGGKTHHCTKLQVGYPPLNSVQIPHIKPQKRVRQNHLDLVRSEESSRTRVPAQPEGQVCLIHADELVGGAGGGAALAVGVSSARASEAEGVELGGVRVEGRVVVDALGGGLEVDAGGNDLTVGEGESLEDLAAEGGWAGISYGVL